MKKIKYIIERKYILIFSILFIICFAIFYLYKNNNIDDKNKITVVCGNDSSGILFDYILKNKDSGIELSDIDYIQFLDCCGSQAEFAFISGRVDMAVLCPDAAFSLTNIDTNYYIVDSIIKDSNVLVYYDENTAFENIGYMNKRLEQEISLREAYSNANLYPILPTALPYALERNAVDAIFIDIVLALNIKNARYKKIDFGKIDYYLVASRKLKGSDIFNNFIEVYNNAVSDIEDESILSNMLIDYLNISNGEIDIWKKMNVRFSKIKAD